VAKKFDPAKIYEKYGSWAEIQKFVKDCTEEEAMALLEYERAHENRDLWVRRFFSRFNKLRGQRERRELAT